MKILSDQRGGALIRLFFALFFVSIGALGWFYFQHRRFPSLNELKIIQTKATREVTALVDKVANPNESGPVTKNSRELCAWLESNTRDSLVKQGLTETDVLKSYNAERQKDGVRWVEQTLEVRWPAGFRPAEFRKDLERLARSKGLSILRDEKIPNTWTLEVGYKDRVFERVVLRKGTGGQSSVVPPTVGIAKNAENPSAVRSLPTDRDQQPTARQTGSAPGGKGSVALVIDDVGYSVSPMDGFLKLDVPLTFAVLPGERHSADMARRAHGAKREVILHLPLEPEDVNDNSPGTHAIFRKMNSEQMRKQFSDDLATVPYAVGVSNHMGSAFTEDERAMTRLMPFLKRAKVFFFDSRTTPRTAGPAVARRFRVPVVENNLFLDNQDSEEFIEKQLKTVERWVLEGKHVAVIGHFQRKHLVTILAREIPRWQEEGIRFTTLSVLIRETPKTGV